MKATVATREISSWRRDSSDGVAPRGTAARRPAAEWSDACRPGEQEEGRFQRCGIRIPSIPPFDGLTTNPGAFVISPGLRLLRSSAGVANSDEIAAMPGRSAARGETNRGCTGVKIVTGVVASAARNEVRSPNCMFPRALPNSSELARVRAISATSSPGNSDGPETGMRQR